MKQRTILVSIIAAAALLFVVLSASTPSRAGPLGVLLVFILVYVMMVGVLMVTLQAGSSLLTRVGRLFGTRRPIEKISVTHSYYYASVLALAPVMLLAMRSVGQIDWRQLLLVVLFTSIACIYIKKRTA